MDAFVGIAHNLRHSSDILHQEGQSSNTFGDVQLDSDIRSEDIINKELKASGVVSYSINEENPQVPSLISIHSL